MRHLDATAIAAMDAGDASARAYFAEHLAQPCEVCEAFLANGELLDGAADAALLGGADPNAPLDELAWRRLQNAQGAPRQVAAPGSVARPVWRWRRAAASAGAIAAVLIASVGLYRFAAERPADLHDGLKSVAPALTLELQAARQNERGEVVRVDPNATLPASGELVLRYYATDKGGAWLFRTGPDGGLEPLGEFELEPGAHPLRLGGGDVAALTLEGEAGELTLLLVGAPARQPTLDEAKRAAEDPGHARLAIAHLTVSVVPSR